MAKNKKKISIGVATRQRPEMLKMCLESLTAQVVPDGAELVIIVVENDREEFSRGVVAAAEKPSAIPIEYHIERHIGISAARNAVLDAAIANGSDYLAFIDDDELAYPEWISRLFAAVTEHGATIVSGPVNRIFPSNGVPAWAQYRYRMIQSWEGTWPNVNVGTLRRNTGNILLDLAPVREHGIRFDMARNLSGDEDGAFLNMLTEQTSDWKAVYVNDAIVCEIVPASRLSMRYRYKANVQAGYNRVRERYLGKRKAQRPIFVLYTGILGVVLAVGGGFSFALLYYFDNVGSVFVLERMGFGVGMLLALIGYNPQFYRNVTGH